MTSITSGDNMTSVQGDPMPSHTPGPWRVSSTGKGVQALFRHDSAGGEVEFWTDVAQTPSQGAVKAHRQANARLIAAAPDMLQVLRAPLLSTLRAPTLRSDNWPAPPSPRPKGDCDANDKWTIGHRAYVDRAPLAHCQIAASAIRSALSARLHHGDCRTDVRCLASGVARNRNAAPEGAMICNSKAEGRE